MVWKGLTDIFNKTDLFMLVLDKLKKCCIQQILKIQIF